MSNDTKTPNFIFSSGHPNPIKNGTEGKRFLVVYPEHKSLMIIPQDSETAQVLETLKTGEAMNLQKVANLMGVPSPMIKDGLTQQFLSDLDKYLAETFCSILPKTE